MPLLHYVEYGKAQQLSLVVIHGLFGSHKNWARISQQLAKQYHVVAIDCRNHGDSFNSLKMDYQLMAEDVLELIKSLGLSQSILLGHSMGGKIAMQLASTYAELFSQLIVVDIAPVTYQHSFDNLLDPLININLTDIKSRKDVDELLKTDIDEDFLRLFLLQSLARIKGCWYWKNDWQNIADNIHSITAAPKLNIANGIDSLFVFGGHSDYYTDEGLESVKQYFSNAKIVVIENGNHYLHYEQAEQFMQELRLFLGLNEL